MARPKNTIEAVQVTVSIPLGLQGYIEQLLVSGLYGRTVSEAMYLIVNQKVHDILATGKLLKLIEEPD